LNQQVIDFLHEDCQASFDALGIYGLQLERRFNQFVYILLSRYSQNQFRSRWFVLMQNPQTSTVPDEAASEVDVQRMI